MLSLSPHAIELINNCEASFIYKCYWPKIKTEASQSITNFGVAFHTIAQHKFSDDKIDELLHSGELENSDTSIIESMIQYVDSIELLKDITDKEHEVDISYKLDKKTKFHGIIDFKGTKIIDGQKKTIIVDWKTGVYQANPGRDFRQMLSYAFLVNKNDPDTKPEDIIMIVVYPRANIVKPYNCNEELLRTHETYIRSVAHYAHKLINKYKKTQSLSSITHTIGNCNICSMCGVCAAYKIIVNADAEIDNQKEMSTNDLVNELISKNELATIYSERVKALKRALLERLESPTTPENEKEYIKTYWDIQTRTIRTIDLSEYVRKRIVPRIRTLMRSSDVTSVLNIDESTIEHIITNELSTIMNINNVTVQQKTAKELNKITIKESKTKPFLIQKL